jgi:hypothetical protein
MGHSDIAAQIEGFAAEVEAAEALGKPHVFGETNSGERGHLSSAIEQS